LDGILRTEPKFYIPGGKQYKREKYENDDPNNFVGNQPALILGDSLSGGINKKHVTNDDEREKLDDKNEHSLSPGSKIMTRS
jgi:hypothetical protein